MRQIFGKRYTNSIEMTMYLVQWYIAQGITTMAHVIMCSHGHHRSVAHAEEAADELDIRFPGLHITVVHLDHQRSQDFRPWPQDFPDSSYGPLSAGDPAYPYWEWFERYVRYPYENALANPPPFLMHLDLFNNY